MAKALSHLRICDLSGQLAGAGATRILAAFGATVIRVEDPVRKGTWDVMRGLAPFVDERRGTELSGAFNNHNVEKFGITLNLRTPRARELLADLIRVSDVVTENFAAGVFARLGFPYERLREIREDIVYVSNSGFGHSGPYRSFKSWGTIVQAFSGLTFSSGLPDLPPAGWGYSIMDHQAANFMALAILAALLRRGRTGEGQWVDIAAAEAGAALLGPDVLDFEVNGRPLNRPGMPHSNRSHSPQMAPHGIYPASGSDCWVAIACRHDDHWRTLRDLIDEDWSSDDRFDVLSGRLERQDYLDARLGEWTAARPKHATARLLQGAGVPAAPVQTPAERIDEDPLTQAWGLWPTVHHPEMGAVRVDGLPVHLSSTDWVIERPAPLLGQHTDMILNELLGIDGDEIRHLHEEGIV